MQNGGRSFVAVVALCVLCPLVLVAPTGPAGAGDATCFNDDPSNHGQMKGDVDGDGNRDQAWIGARRRNSRCRYLAKVDLGTSMDTERLPGDRQVLRDFAHVMAMIKVDTVPGKEFGIVLQQGASTTFAGLFTIRANQIHRMHVEGAGAPPDDLFGYGGSIGFQTASDCARNRPDGQVIYSEASINQAGTHYKVKRRWFQVVGIDFQRTSEATDERRIRAENLHERFYEFNNSPFGSCPGRAPG
jgi:hypothetical protein